MFCRIRASAPGPTTVIRRRNPPREVLIRPRNGPEYPLARPPTALRGSCRTVRRDTFVERGWGRGDDFLLFERTSETDAEMC